MPNQTSSGVQEPAQSRIPTWARACYAQLGRVGKTFFVCLFLYLLFQWVVPIAALRALAGTGAFVTGVWLAYRVFRAVLRKVVWRLRNRLLVTYLFIAIVPIVLILTLAAISAASLFSQFAVYLVTSELDRRVSLLDSATQDVANANPRDQENTFDHRVEGLPDAMPGAEGFLRSAGRTVFIPKSTAPDPALPDGWPTTNGVVVRNGQVFLWSHRRLPQGEAAIFAPIERLGGLLHFGRVDFGMLGENAPVQLMRPLASFGSVPPSLLPEFLQQMDQPVTWFATIPTADWNRPQGSAGRLIINVRSRPSALIAAVFTRESDFAQGVLTIGLLIVAGLFVLVELVSVVIGIRLTRTITGAVHRLYDGTQRVAEGDFSHRIKVTGSDQLAELSRSFNRMTEQVEHLLVVSKEKERLQSELEIAREVQARLFPRRAPESRTLRIRGVCNPARLVSGDYFDYEALRDSRIALALGDVAGKGISAALLMASLQSSLRAQLQDPEAAVSPSKVVSRINVQLHASTAPEKFATFCFGVFDETQGKLAYTNAGHLPPMLIRGQKVQRLEVSGTVVGAFPFAKYEESCVQLESGDLLAFFTDGISEPENVYGEMFGEDRLAEMLVQNAHRSEEEIISTVLDSVQMWSGSGELQDDMTLLLVRRL